MKSKQTYTLIMDKDISEYFVSLIESSGAIDVAEAEFKRIVADDNDLRELYRQWCADTGTSERHGFSDFATEYMENREEVWNSLNDYDE